MTASADVERAYLDHASTTPMCPEAVEAMLPYLTDRFGNPSGSHHESRRVRRAVDEARDQIAAIFGTGPGSVIFTAGGTEADNLGVTGLWAAAAGREPSPRALVCSAMEHHAVLMTCRALARQTGAELREVASDKDGIIDLAELDEACTEEVGLVAVMTVNNETGTIQPLDRVASVVGNRAPKAALHTDAVQAVSWLEVGAVTSPADLVAISAHKFGGPQGVGALISRGDATVGPVIHGGGQERDRRSGTHNVAGIVAMATALSVTEAHRRATTERVTARRDRLGDGLLATVSGASETGLRQDTVAGHLHLRFSGVESEALVVLCDQGGVAASAGAACSSGAVEASHVLLAMGLAREEASTGIRFSLGATTTDADIDHALRVVPTAVAQLRD